MQSETKIVSVTIPQGNAIYKTTTNSGANGFGIATILELEDGRKLPSFEATQRKRDLLAFVASQDAKAKNGNLVALFEDGKFWGTRSSYHIGPAK